MVKNEAGNPGCFRSVFLFPEIRGLFPGTEDGIIAVRKFKYLVPKKIWNFPM